MVTSGEWVLPIDSHPWDGAAGNGLTAVTIGYRLSNIQHFYIYLSVCLLWIYSGDNWWHTACVGFRCVIHQEMNAESPIVLLPAFRRTGYRCRFAGWCHFGPSEVAANRRHPRLPRSTGKSVRLVSVSVTIRNSREFMFYTASGRYITSDRIQARCLRMRGFSSPCNIIMIA